ncbi:galactose-1-phosphate uridylyltransferase [Methanolinea mesophila]|uniref:galactose-1-phosphate uridylyltransferase n=1 Tax=Methanolinea mesophila TaxID=547055 RepID=UPI001AE3424E|nr:galactose-1-phosphate uridylyltransferase [Methanolinea mesophila]MBP1928542.1 galactose-1-phosphate uridylyltransferase [Methanolinea mesophila]
MFSITEIRNSEGVLQFREDHLTGLRCKISPGRLKRGLDAPYVPPPVQAGCPFCKDQILTATPTFPNGERIFVGESVTFPNLFPFAEWHTVTVITRDHLVDRFTVRQLADALTGQVRSLSDARGYPSINWNYLPSAGASIAHPHLQGLVDRRPTVLAEKYLLGSTRYRVRTGRCYWEDLVEGEKDSERYLFGDEITWLASAVPQGEREVRGILPVASLVDFESYVVEFAEGIIRVLEYFRTQGTHSINMSVFFDSHRGDGSFRAFSSMISRINPNGMSLADTAFMERLHLEPVILTLPEELGSNFRKIG